MSASGGLFDYDKVNMVLLNDGWHSVKPGTFDSAIDPESNVEFFVFGTATTDNTVYVVPELLHAVRVSNL